MRKLIIMQEKQIIELLNKGEGINIEFKESRNKLNRDVFESVCAFLNRNGGHLFLGVKDDGTVIGIDEDSEYENAEIQVPKNSDLYIFSDGIYEIKKINKEMMHLEEFIAFLVEAQACKDKNCQSFIRSIEKQSITGGFEDDVSLLHLHFN